MNFYKKFKHRLFLKLVLIPCLAILASTAYSADDQDFSVEEQFISEKLDNLIQYRNGEKNHTKEILHSGETCDFFGDKNGKMTTLKIMFGEKDFDVEVTPRWTTKKKEDNTASWRVISKYVINPLVEKAQSLVWGCGTLERKNGTVNFDEETYTVDFIYHNSAQGKIPMTFTLRSKFIKTVKECLEAIDENTEQEVSKKISSDKEKKPSVFLNPLQAKSVKVELLGDTESDGEENVEDEDESKAYAHLQFFEFPSEDEGVRGLVNGVILRLESIRKAIRVMRKTAANFDHIWTAGAAGSSAVGCAFNAACNFDIVSGIYALGYGAVAAKSTMRVYNDFYGTQGSETRKILDDITKSNDQIIAYSESTSNLLESLRKNLSTAVERVEKLEVEHNELSKLAHESSENLKEELEKTLALHAEAKEQAEKAKEAFENFEKQVETVNEIWSKVNNTFQSIEHKIRNFSLDKDLSQEDAEKHFNTNVSALEKDINKVRKLLNSLETPMKEQEQYGILVNEHRNKQDELLSEVSTQIRDLLKNLDDSNKELQEKFKTMSVQFEDLEKNLQEQISKCVRGKKEQKLIKLLAEENKENCERLRKADNSKFSEKDLRNGIITGVVVSVCVVPFMPVLVPAGGFVGMGVSIGGGYLGCKTSQTLSSFVE